MIFVAFPNQKATMFEGINILAISSSISARRLGLSIVVLNFRPSTQFVALRILLPSLKDQSILSASYLLTYFFIET